MRVNVCVCAVCVYVCVCVCLLLAGSEEHEVLQTWSIYAAILLLLNSFRTVHFKYTGIEIIWVVKIRNTSEAVLRPQYTPWPSY